MRHQVLSFSPFLWFPCSDIAEEKGAFELPGAWWLSRFLQQTGSLSGYDDLQSTFSKLQFYILWSVRQVFCSSHVQNFGCLKSLGPSRVSTVELYEMKCSSVQIYGHTFYTFYTVMSRNTCVWKIIKLQSKHKETKGRKISNTWNRQCVETPVIVLCM